MESVTKTLTKPFRPKTIQEQRVTVVGTMGSGKTTVLGCLYLTAVDKANREKNFRCRINEKTSGIRQVPSDLRDGLFPEPTPQEATFEADLLMRWEQLTNTQTIRLPFCETAGEEIQKLIGKFQEGVYVLNPEDYTQPGLLYEYVLRSNGFIVVAPVTRAQLIGGSTEASPTKIQDPDVNISRLLDCIFTYKERTAAPQIKGIAVLLTKYDAETARLADQGMDLTNPVGVEKFMRTYFPDTYATLQFYGLHNVKFWPTWVELAQDPKTREAIKHPIRGYRIKVNYQRRVPYYSEKSYLELIDWIKGTFTG